MDKKMGYAEIRNTVEKLGNENYRDFIKALVSYEKGINDENALDDIYDDFMDMDTKGLIHEDFDYVIDELRENGRIDDTIKFVPERNDFISATGNLLKDAEEVIRENNDGEKFNVCNVTLVSEDNNGERVYTNASAYGEGENGKEFKNLRVVSSKLLKAKNQIKDIEEKKDSVIGAIKKFQEEDMTNKTEKPELEAEKDTKISFER